jgi:adenine-specific DNA-methyltransferase
VRTTQQSTYYKAILQNLFFATLNTEMNTPAQPRNRMFRSAAERGGFNRHYGVHSFYRYAALFQIDEASSQALFATIPFLNGGLFECLDRPEQGIRIDGFSDRADNPLHAPNVLFFGHARPLDLNEVFGTRNKQYQVRGLFEIFRRYKFTIEENTPIDEEVALDPELLGKVFENLLAAYNPETRTTARKQTGSFYTPREIVDYMVDEALIAALGGKLRGARGEGRIAGDAVEARLRQLFAYTDEPHQFTPAEVTALITAIDNAKILDLACGSGAFPMGVLHKLVFILRKLDPNNAGWKQQQLARAQRDRELAEQMEDEQNRDNAVKETDARIRDIEQSFGAQDHELDYTRKLYLIENCIYGVDIQPIAVQIAKLRFFISLVADQRVDDSRPNRNVRALPNLETKFVAANALIGLPRSGQMLLRNPEIDRLEGELRRVRQRHFTARTTATKKRYREEDARLRERIGELLRQDGWPKDMTVQLAHWDPYNQNAHAEFFDPEWMFGLTDGFNVVIGNPPYVRQEQLAALKPRLQAQYTCYTGTADLYVYFYERGLQLLHDDGVLTYISSNKYFRAGYGAKLRGHLASQTRIVQLTDFGDAPVFTAIAYPSIIVTQRAAATGHELRALTWPAGAPLEEFAATFHERSFLIAQRELTADGWRLEVPSVLRLMEKLRTAGKPLGEYVNGRLYRGIITGLNEALVIDRMTYERLIAERSSSVDVLKPFLRGRDVKRWHVQFADQYLIKFESSENKRHPWTGQPEPEAERIFAATYPAIYEHLTPFREALKNRQDQGRYYWELRSCTYWEEFAKPKIIYPDIYEHQSFAWDGAGFLSGNTCYFIPDGGLWLCGLLNSSLIEWFYAQVSNRIRGGYLRSFTDYIRQIPIASPSQVAALQNIVESILAFKSQNPAADVIALEAEIDRLVYGLYGLTAAEIQIVEGAG